MFPYQRLIAFSFGAVGVLLLFLMIKIYLDQKPPPTGDDKGSVIALISTVTLTSYSSFSVAEELTFSLNKPISSISRHFPKELAHSLGIQTQSISFLKALDLSSFTEVPIETTKDGIVLKFPFKSGYRLDYSVESPPIEINGLKYFYFRQTSKFPLDIPSAKIIIKFENQPAEVKGYIETTEFKAMKGKTSSGSEVSAYLPVTEDALVNLSQNGYEITNPRPLLSGETLSVLAIL